MFNFTVVLVTDVLLQPDHAYLEQLTCQSAKQISQLHRIQKTTENIHVSEGAHRDFLIIAPYKYFYLFTTYSPRFKLPSINQSTTSISEPMQDWPVRAICSQPILVASGLARIQLLRRSKIDGRLGDGTQLFNYRLPDELYRCYVLRLRPCFVRLQAQQ